MKNAALCLALSVASATAFVPSGSAKQSTKLGITIDESQSMLEKIKLIVAMESTPAVDPKFDKIVKGHFPNAVSNQALETAVVDVLSKKGFTGANTLLATSLCCDELARKLEGTLQAWAWYCCWKQWVSRRKICSTAKNLRSGCDKSMARLARSLLVDSTCDMVSVQYSILASVFQNDSYMPVLAVWYLQTTSSRSTVTTSSLVVCLASPLEETRPSVPWLPTFLMTVTVSLFTGLMLVLPRTVLLERSSVGVSSSLIAAAVVPSLLLDTLLVSPTEVLLWMLIFNPSLTSNRELSKNSSFRMESVWLMPKTACWSSHMLFMKLKISWCARLLRVELVVLRRELHCSEESKSTPARTHQTTSTPSDSTSLAPVANLLRTCCPRSFKLN